MKYIYFILLYILVIVAASLLYLGLNIDLLIYFTAALYFLILIERKMSPSDPSIWFVFFINAYHLSAFYLHEMGFIALNNPTELVYANLLAITGFITSRILFFNNTKNVEITSRSKLPFGYTALKHFYSITFIASLFVSLDFLMSGATIKADYGNNFGSVFSIMNLAFAFLLISLKRKNGKIPFWFVLLNFLYLFFVTLLLGERNIIASFSLILVVVAYLYWGLSRVAVISSGVILLLLIPILGEFKNVFTRQESQPLAISSHGIMYRLTNGEFRSAGRNFDKVVSKDEDDLLGTTLIGDVGRSIVPGFIYKFENGVLWYNRNYNASILAQGRGYGFSLAAEGYVNFSWAGVLLWFFLVGVLINYLELKSRKSELFLIIYVVMIPVFIYSLRGDMSTIFSPLFKQIGLPLLLIFLIDHLVHSYRRGR